MNNDYFYSNESDRFKFFSTPKELFTPKFKNLSPLAKLLYGILLDRNSLSAKNNWIDNENRIYIIFTRDSVMEMLCVGKNKATELFKELSKFGLIEEKRQGLNKPNLIYVKKFYSTKNATDNGLPKTGNQESRNSGIKSLEFRDGTYTDISDTFEEEETTQPNVDTPLCVETLQLKINLKMKQEIAKETIIDLLNVYDFDLLNYYLDNWDKWDYITKVNPFGFFIKLVEQKAPIPVKQFSDFKQNKKNKPVEQATNFKQRKYEDDEFEQYYS